MSTTQPLTYELGAAWRGVRPVMMDATGTPDGHALVSRAVACVNALAGVEDPAAALAEVRRLLAEAVARLHTVSGMMSDADREDVDAADVAARAALALLGGAP